MFKPHIVPSPCCHLWFWWYICLIIVTFSLDANFNRQYQREGDQQSSGTFNLFFSDSLYQFYHHENIKKSRQILFKEIWDQISPLNGKQHSWSLDFSSVCLIVYKLLFHLLACSLFHHHLPGNNINPWRGNVKTEECVSPFRIQNWQRLVKEKSILSKSLLNWHCVLNICQLFLWKQKYALSLKLRRRKPASREKIGRRGCGPRCWLYNCRTLSNGELQRGREGGQ